MLLWGKKKEENILEMAPKLYEWLTLKKGPNGESSTLIVPRTSWIEKMSVRFFKQPESIKVDVTGLGSFVLDRCDGEHNVQEIAEQLSFQYGEEAEPVIPRLVKYLEIVEMNGWITWKRGH